MSHPKKWIIPKVLETVARQEQKNPTMTTACERWADEMRVYIERDEWERLCPAPCSTQACEACEACEACDGWMVAHPLSYFMNGFQWFRPRYGSTPSRVWTPAVQQAVERLHRNDVDWCELVMDYAPPHTVLRYLFANHLIDPSDADPVTYMALYTGDQQYETLEYLTSELKINMNLQNAMTGNTALMVYMKMVYEDGGYEDDLRAHQVMTHAEYRDYLRESLRRIQWYLRWGSDPLLENREGESAMSMARSLSETQSHVPEDIRRQLVILLELYA